MQLLCQLRSAYYAVKADDTYEHRKQFSELKEKCLKELGAFKVETAIKACQWVLEDMSKERK